jgi:hypothetical protein
METALRSPERALAAEDAKKLPQFTGEVKRRTFEVTDYGVGAYRASMATLMKRDSWCQVNRRISPDARKSGARR